MLPPADHLEVVERHAGPDSHAGFRVARDARGHPGPAAKELDEPVELGATSGENEAVAPDGRPTLGWHLGDYPVHRCADLIDQILDCAGNLGGRDLR